MVKAVRVHVCGGPEVLRVEDVGVGEPGEGQVRLRHTAVGLNYIDVYFRTGLYPPPGGLPFTPGSEGVGVVVAVGPGPSAWRLGDRAAYAGRGGFGSYAEERLIDADRLVPLPAVIDDVTAAASMLKGMTAQFLLRTCFKVEMGHRVLVHAAAGGVGSLLCQWARHLGAIVIGTVSSDAKAAQALADGAHHAIVYTRDNVVERVRALTDGAGVHVVYDSVGKDTFEMSLECLAVRGMLVSFGQASGPVPPVPLQKLAAKSLYLARPSLMDYTETREDLLRSAGELFAVISGKLVVPRVERTYALADVAQAHADLEARRTTGSCVLIP